MWAALSSNGSSWVATVILSLLLAIALALYLIEIASQGAEALQHRMRRPVWTRKIKTVVGVAGAIEAIGVLVAVLLSGGDAHPLRLLGALLLLDRTLFELLDAVLPPGDAMAVSPLA